MPKSETLSRDWMIENYAPVQFDAAVEVLSSAFLDDPASIYIFPGVLKRKQELHWLFNLILHYGYRHGRVFTAAREVLEQWRGLRFGFQRELAVNPMTTQVRLGMWVAPFSLGFRSLKRVVNYSNYLDRLRKRYAKQNFLWMLGNSSRPIRAKAAGTPWLRKV